MYRISFVALTLLPGFCHAGEPRVNIFYVDMYVSGHSRLIEREINQRETERRNQILDQISPRPAVEAPLDVAVELARHDRNDGIPTTRVEILRSLKTLSANYEISPRQVATGVYTAQRILKARGLNRSTTTILEGLLKQARRDADYGDYPTVVDFYLTQTVWTGR
ncbi:hypothetical protein [Rhodopirellula baltica]|nr:hypothetical protein [Rhodopirellula baltica]